MSTPGPFLIDNLSVLAENVIHGDGTTLKKGIPDLYDYDGADFGERFNAAIADLQGGSLFIPPDVYITATEPFLTGTLTPMAIYAHGATIKTVGAIAALKITAGRTVWPVDVYGLRVDHTGNTNALYGINIEGCWHVRLHSPTLVAAGVAATYAAIRIANIDPADDNTGSFWTKVYDAQIRRSSGSDGTRPPIGILLEGASNATSIMGGGIEADTCVTVRNYAGFSYAANALLIHGAAFESYVTAIRVSNTGGGASTGHRYVNNRFESGTTVLDLTDVSTNPATPFYLAGNHLISNAGTYLVNPNNVYVNSLDMAITPSLAGVGTKWKQDTIIEAKDGNGHPLTLRPAGGLRGIRLERADTSEAACFINWMGTGNKAEIRANTGAIANLHLTGVAGINGTGHGNAVNNLRGRTTFTTAATKAVTFAAAEYDALFHIVVTGNVDENFWITDKATTGFTINSSNASSTATVDWILIR